MGGYYPINLASIRIMDTAKNFEDMVAALTALDTLLSGGNIRVGYDIKDEHVKLLKRIF